MKIALVDESHLPGILVIKNRAIRETTASFHVDPMTIDCVRGEWSPTAPVCPWFVMVDDDDVVAFASSVPYHGRCGYRFAVETSIYVSPTHHRRGIGRRLYGELLRMLDAQGYATQIGIIATPNEASEALHESLGFQHVGTLERVGWKFDAWRDVAIYQRSVADGETPREIRSVADVVDLSE